MKYKYIIINSDPETNSDLEKLVNLRTELKHQNTFNSIPQALNYLEETGEKPDLAFIYIKGINLDELKETMTAKNLNNSYTVCIAEHPNQAHHSYEIGFNDFLAPPIQHDRFNLCVDRMLKHSATKSNAYFMAKLKRGDTTQVAVYYKDLTIIESDGNYLKFITEENTYTRYGTLSGMEKKLEGKPYIRINRSFIISTNHIEGRPVKHQVKMIARKEPISIGSQFRLAFKKAIGSAYI